MAVDLAYPEYKYPTQNAFWDAVISPNCFPIPNQRLERQSTLKENQLTSEVADKNVPYYCVGWSDNIKLTADEADEVTLMQVDVEAYVDHMIGKFINGDASIDAEFDAYVAGCNSRGLERYVEIYQTAYDRWTGAGKQ